MNMPSCMLWAMYEVFEELDVGYLAFFCDRSESKEATLCFKSAFGECSITENDDGFVVHFSALEYDDYSEDFGFTSVMVVPIEQTLRIMETKFPNIRYQGVSCYAFRTLKYGDMGWKEYKRGIDEHTTYEVVGKMLDSAMEEDLFWMYLIEETDLTETDIIDIKEFCTDYAVYLSSSSIEKLQAFLSEYGN